MSELRLRTRLEPLGPAAAIILDDQQVAALGGGRVPPVVVMIGQRSFRGRVARMGDVTCVGLSRAARAQLGVGIGDDVEVVLTLDTEERTVEVPPALREALDADAGAAAAFATLSYTRRKEMAASIADARREDTRARRLTRALDELRGRGGS